MTSNDFIKNLTNEILKTSLSSIKEIRKIQEEYFEIEFFDGNIIKLDKEDEKLYEFILNLEYINIPIRKYPNKLEIISKEEIENILIKYDSPWDIHEENLKKEDPQFRSIAFYNYINSWNKYCVYLDVPEKMVYPIHRVKEDYMLFKNNDFSYENEIKKEIEYIKSLGSDIEIVETFKNNHYYELIYKMNTINNKEVLETLFDTYKEKIMFGAIESIVDYNNVV